MKKYIPFLATIFVIILVIVIGFNKQEEKVPCLEAPQKIEGVAKITLAAPETCKIGELVTLDASASEAASFSWEVEPTTTNFAVIEDGKRAFFTAAKPGIYTFFCAAAKENTVDTVIHKIRVIGSKVPIIQDDFTIMVKSWLPQEADPKLLYGLARSFEEAANSESIEDMIKVTASMNRAVLGLSLSDYKMFLQSFSMYLRENYQDKSLDEHRQLWRNVAKALQSC